MLDEDIAGVMTAVRKRLNLAPLLNSPHEGFAHIRMALDRLWNTIIEDSYRNRDWAPLLHALTAEAIAYVIDLTPFSPGLASVARTELAIEAVSKEVRKATLKHPPLNSIFEAYGVILEEVDELFEEVRPDRGRSTEAQKEAVQIAAMGVRTILDVVGV